MSQTQPGKKVFFDVTDLRHYLRDHGSVTGIQRVVVMVLLETCKILGNQNVFLSFLDFDTGEYRTVPTTHLLKNSNLTQEKLLAALNVQSAENFIRPTLEKYRDKRFRLLLHTLIRDFKAHTGNEAHFRKRRSSINEWKGSKPTKSYQIAAHFDFFSIARKGDVLFLAGAAWFSGSHQTFCRVKNSGIHIVALIHDLIPVVMPKFVASDHPIKFHDWLLDSIEYVDHYISNSKTTNRDLENFIHAYKGVNPTSIVPLAQDKIPNYAPPLADKKRQRINKDAYPDLYESVAVSEHIRALTKNPYVLVVGTTDIRKNIWSLLQAWSLLVDHHDLQVPKLIIAGRNGAMNGDCEDFLASSGNLNGWVVRVIGPTDLELAYLYRNCLFTAMPSYYEGWGLPIGESLSYGKTAVVSDVSSMPEVGEHYVEYCDPTSIDSIYKACLKLVSDDEYRTGLEQKIRRATLRSWSDVAQDMVDVLLPEK